EGQGTDLAVVAGKLARQPPLAQFPDANDAVIVTGGQETRVYAKGKGRHPGRLPERDQELCAAHIPDRGCIAGGGEETPVRAELPGRLEIAKEVIRALSPVEMPAPQDARLLERPEAILAGKDQVENVAVGMKAIIAKDAHNAGCRAAGVQESRHRGYSKQGTESLSQRSGSQTPFVQTLRPRRKSCARPQIVQQFLANG